MKTLSAGLISVLATFLSTQAIAHVTFDETQTEPGRFHTAKLRVMHGCGESPTTSVTINIPEGVTRVTPRDIPGWEVQVKMKTLSKPVELHGFEMTETIGSVTWSGGSLPSFAFEQFEMRLMLPDTPNTRIDFLVDQICEEGELHWHDIAKPGVDPWSLDEPAPFINLAPKQKTE